MTDQNSNVDYYSRNGNRVHKGHRDVRSYKKGNGGSDGSFERCGSSHGYANENKGSKQKSCGKNTESFVNWNQDSNADEDAEYRGDYY